MLKCAAAAFARQRPRNRVLRITVWLAVWLCLPGLWVAHAFDHPIQLTHADHSCLICAHGHPGNAPPSGPPTGLRTQPDVAATAAVIAAVWWPRPLRVYYGRAPPDARV